MDEMLMHYGVKGMKWGVRRTPAQLGHTKTIVSRKEKKKPEDYYRLPESKIGKKIREYLDNIPVLEENPKQKDPGYALYANGQKKQKVSDMSDQELQRKIDRIQKEKKYKELVKSPYVKAGETIVKTVIVAAGTEVAKETIKKILKDQLQNK